jgi:hypothetical protein
VILPPPSPLLGLESPEPVLAVSLLPAQPARASTAVRAMAATAEVRVLNFMG